MLFDQVRKAYDTGSEMLFLLHLTTKGSDERIRLAVQALADRWHAIWDYSATENEAERAACEQAVRDSGVKLDTSGKADAVNTIEAAIKALQARKSK